MKKPYARTVALLGMVILLSVFPVLSTAVAPGDPAISMEGLPGDQAYGVIYYVERSVLGFDLYNGAAPEIPVNASSDGKRINNLPDGTMIFKFVQADAASDYYLTVGGKYLSCRAAAGNQAEQLVLTDAVEQGARWTFVPDQAGRSGYFNIKNAEYRRDGADEVYLAQCTEPDGANSFRPDCYAADQANRFQMKFFSSAEDEDGRVGDIAASGSLPLDGRRYVVYNQLAGAVIGQPTGPEAAFPALLPASAQVKNNAIAYEDVADGALIFTVHVFGTASNPVYAFESGGKYLAVPEQTVDGYDGTLLLIDWPKDSAQQGLAQWTLRERDDAYEIRNKARGFCSVEYFNGVFSVWSDSAERADSFAMCFYPMEDKDGQGYVVHPCVRIETPYPAIGADCPVCFTLDDAGTPESVFAQYQVDSRAAVSVEPELSGKQGSFTIPAAALEGGSVLKLTVSARNTIPKIYSATLEAEICDEPLILSILPAANAATGKEKRPEIAVTFSNAGQAPSFAMLVDGEAVAAGVSGSKLSYIPAESMRDGAHSVSVTITRADGKSVSRNWSFFVGAMGETLYFGQLHSHTAEYSDGAGSLEDAYAHAHSVDDMDFLIVTDHSTYFDSAATASTASYYDLRTLTRNADGNTTKWEEARATARYCNEQYDDLICAYGYEMSWSGGPGHITSLNSYGVLSRNSRELNNKTGYAGMHLYYDLMVNAEKGLAVDGTTARIQRAGTEASGVYATKYIPFDSDGNSVPVVSQFNHPGSAFGNFDSFAGYTPARDELLNLIEVGNGEGQPGSGAYFPSYEQYDLCLSMGWHVGPTNNQDNHWGSWGDANSCRSVILTDDFSEAGLYRALGARRVYATEDQNLRISYELEANGMRFKLGDIAPFEAGTQPETVTILLHVADPDRDDAIATVEVIGENGTSLKRIGVNATEYDGEIVLDNTDSYYYIRVVEEDGAIAVTAPVWMKGEIPVSAELASSALIAVQGEEETITATLRNDSASEPLYCRGYQIEADGCVLADETGLDLLVEPGQVETVSLPFIPVKTDPPARKTYSLSVRFQVDYKGEAFNCEKTIAESAAPAEDITFIALDRGHDNDCVSGDCAGSVGTFLRLCAQRGIVCQYIERGEMTSEKLAKYKAVVITVPRRDGAHKPTAWTEAELEALADYAAGGGTILNFSKSDRLDYVELADGQDSGAYASAALSNAINKAVGAQTRFVRGIAVDSERNTGEAFCIDFAGWELLGDSPFTAGIYPSSNGIFQWDDGTGITIDPCLRFRDVKRNKWYHECVDFVLEHGLMSGTSPTTFEPDTIMSREMFVTILWRIAGSPIATVTNPFTDVKKSNWSYQAILWAVESGVTKGKTPTTFDRLAPVSREEMAVFLYSFARSKGMDLSASADLSVFPDAKSVSKFARTAMKWAVANRLISGRNTGGKVILDPKSSSTRAMGATVLRAFVTFSGETLPKADTAVTALLRPYDSTWVSAYQNYFTGSSFQPSYDDGPVMAKKGSFALVTAEKLSGGGWLICSGATFLSDSSLQPGLSAARQSENYLMLCNILDYLQNGAFSGEITPIAEVQKGKPGQTFTVEGWVSSNASDYDKDTAFFDCIYIQDGTRGIRCFPVSGYYRIGEKLRVHGSISSSHGELVLNLDAGSDGTIQVISNELCPVEPATVSCKEAMRDGNIGNLMKISGTVTEIHRTSGVIDRISVDDGSGEQALLCIDPYIQKDSSALDAAQPGMHIEAVGIGACGAAWEDGGDSGGSVRYLRVRARDELILSPAKP